MSTFPVEPTLRRAKDEERAVDEDDLSLVLEGADVGVAVVQPVVPVVAPGAVVLAMQPAGGRAGSDADAANAAPGAGEPAMPPLVPVVAPAVSSAIMPVVPVALAAHVEGEKLRVVAPVAAVEEAKLAAAVARERVKVANEAAVQANTSASIAREALTCATGKHNEAREAYSKAQGVADLLASGKTKTSADKIATGAREFKIMTATACDNARRWYNAVLDVSVAAAQSLVSLENVRDAALLVETAEVAVAALALPLDDSDADSKEVLGSRDRACLQLQRLREKALEDQAALLLAATPVAELSRVASEARAAVEAAEKAALKKRRKRKGGGSGGGGGKRKQKAAPDDAVPMSREIWDRWKPRHSTGIMEKDHRFEVKRSSVLEAGDGLYAAKALPRYTTIEFMYSPTIHSRLTSELKVQYKGMLIDTGFNVDLDRSASAVNRYGCSYDWKMRFILFTLSWLESIIICGWSVRATRRSYPWEERGKPRTFKDKPPSCLLTRVHPGMCCRAMVSQCLRGIKLSYLCPGIV